MVSPSEVVLIDHATGTITPVDDLLAAELLDRARGVPTAAVAILPPDEEDAENAGLEASARSYGAEFETKVKMLRSLKAKPSVIRSALVQDVAASAVTGSRSAAPKAADIEPRRDGTSAAPVIDTAAIYQRANSRSPWKRA